MNNCNDRQPERKKERRNKKKNYMATATRGGKSLHET